MSEVERRFLEQQENPEDETQYLSQSIIVMLVLVVVNTISLSYLKKAREKYVWVGRFLQDALVTTLIGIIAGTILKIAGSEEVLHTIRDGYSNFFMIILLPPIIFESAINMHKRSFFKNIGSILMFAVFGTFLATVITAVFLFLVSLFAVDGSYTFKESFAFGALISATDPVTVLAIFKQMNADRNLYSLIFGESILNDAISIVLYKTVASMETETYEGGFFTPIGSFMLEFFGSVLLGFLIGIVCAIILKKYFGSTSRNSDQESTETTMMILIPWVSYLVGEGFKLSGIVVILFCGISMSKYALPNLSQPGKRLTQKLYLTLSSTFEHLVFLFIGIGFFSFDHQWRKMGVFIFIITPIIITFARFSQVKLICKLLNKFRRKGTITDSHQNVIIYSGFRGAMAFALATHATKTFLRNDAGSQMLTLTLVYAALTIFILGTFLIPILDYYDVTAKTGSVSELDEKKSDELYFWDRVKEYFKTCDEILTKLIVREGEIVFAATSNQGEDNNLSQIKKDEDTLETPSRINESPEKAKPQDNAINLMLNKESDDNKVISKNLNVVQTEDKHFVLDDGVQKDDVFKAYDLTSDEQN